MPPSSQSSSQSSSRAPLPLPVAVFLERAVRALLRHDPDTRERVSRSLEGRVVRVRVTRPAVELAIAVVDGRVDVLRVFDGEADVTIEGSLAAFRSLQQGNDALYDGRVRVTGDLGIARSLREIVAGLDIDPEELAAPIVGGTLARRLGVAGRGARAWLGRMRASFRANAAEYLNEESELLAPADEIRHWSAEVDAMRAAADRLEARVTRLERRSDPDEGAS